VECWDDDKTEGGKKRMRTILSENLPGRLSVEEIRPFETWTWRMTVKAVAIAAAFIVIVSVLFLLGD
jgi:hypothetical protein